MKLEKKKKKAEIPSDSMADIAFLLIIFFMLTTTFSVNKGFDYGIPPVEEELEQESTETRAALTIIVENTPSRDYQVVVVDQNGEKRTYNAMNIGSTTLKESVKDTDAKGNIVGVITPGQYEGGLYTYMENTFKEVQGQNPEWYKLPVYVLVKRNAPFEGFVDVWEEVRRLEEVWTEKFPDDVEEGKRKLSTHVPNVGKVEDILNDLRTKYPDLEL